MLRVWKSLKSTKSSETENINECGWLKVKAVVLNSLLPPFPSWSLFIFNFFFSGIVCSHILLSLQNIYNCPLLLLFSFSIPLLTLLCLLSIIFLFFGLPCFTSGFPDGLFYPFPEFHSSPISYSLSSLTLPTLFLQLQFFPLKISLGHTGFYSCSSV